MHPSGKFEGNFQYSADYACDLNAKLSKLNVK